MSNPAWQMLDRDVALLMRLSDGRWGRHAGRKVKNGWCRYLGIDEGLAISHGAGERVPAIVDIDKDFCARGVLCALCL